MFGEIHAIAGMLSTVMRARCDTVTRVTAIASSSSDPTLYEVMKYRVTLAVASLTFAFLDFPSPP
jgi:hypothetical protein